MSLHLKFDEAINNTDLARHYPLNQLAVANRRIAKRINQINFSTGATSNAVKLRTYLPPLLDRVGAMRIKTRKNPLNPPRPNHLPQVPTGHKLRRDFSP